MSPGSEDSRRLKESPQLNEIERGQKRVKLPPLKEGPFGKGEENNLCEVQNRQRAILEIICP
jgi:hypothetical protein